MDLTRGYNLSPAMQARIRILDWIADNGGTSPLQMIDLGPLFEGLDYDASAAIAGHLEGLASSGYIRLHWAASWEGGTCDVLPAGVDLIEELQTQRGDLRKRRQQARDAFLRWLFDCTLNGNECPSSGDFPASKYGTHYGDAFTDKDMETASEWLRDKGYVHGDAVWGGGITRPMITTKGQKVVESER